MFAGNCQLGMPGMKMRQTSRRNKRWEEKTEIESAEDCAVCLVHGQCKGISMSRSRSSQLKVTKWNCFPTQQKQKQRQSQRPSTVAVAEWKWASNGNCPVQQRRSAGKQASDQAVVPTSASSQCALRGSQLASAISAPIWCALAPLPSLS